MMRRSMVGMSLALGMALVVHDSARSSPPPRPQPAARSWEAQSVLAGMHRTFNAVRALNRALVVGDLEAVRQEARSLARMSVPGELADRAKSVDRVRSAARKLAAARSARAARSAATELASRCADCHRDSADLSRFVWSPEPSDDGSAFARMARHRWAAESAWMGLIGPSEDRWREGLEALRAAPLLPEAMSDDRGRYAEIERLSSRLAGLAERARPLKTSRERAASFADMIGVCSDCHALARR